MSSDPSSLLFPVLPPCYCFPQNHRLYHRWVVSLHHPWTLAAALFIHPQWLCSDFSLGQKWPAIPSPFVEILSHLSSFKANSLSSKKHFLTALILKDHSLFWPPTTLSHGMTSGENNLPVVIFILTLHPPNDLSARIWLKNLLNLHREEHGETEDGPPPLKKL